MYWLGFLKEAREAGELDWEAIGGTWGVATSRLNEWQRPKDIFFPKHLETAIEEVARPTNKNGFVLSQYIAKYFVDMWSHLASMRSVMRSGGRVHYIVGNSKFYETMIAVESIYAEMLKRLGFKNVSAKAIRKRNSKKELFEYVVSATV